MNIFEKLENKEKKRIEKRYALFREKQIKREKKAKRTKCEQCGEKPAYSYYYDGSMFVKIQGKLNINLCKSCHRKFEERYVITGVW